MEKIIELINQTLKFNNIKSFKDIIDFKGNTLNDDKLFSIADKQWVNNINRVDSNVMLYQIYENLYISYKEFLEKQIPIYLKCFRPFDIYFIIGQHYNFYIVMNSNIELYLIPEMSDC